jgi:peroxiredoxin
MIPAILLTPILAVSMPVDVSQQLHAGDRITDFSLKAMDGRTVTYSSLAGRIVVVTFISTRCPISNAFNYRMNELYREFAGRVTFLFVNSNANEPADEVRDHAKAAGYDFPVYKDVESSVANLFGAEATPDTFVVDSTGIIRYHGYIEDAPNPARAKNRALRTAIEATLEGKPVLNPETRAFGCAIKRPRTRIEPK